MERAIERWFCQGIETPKLEGEMISREASITAVARLALDMAVLETLSRDCRRAGKTSHTHMAMRLAGSGCMSRRARWQAEYANRRFSRLGFSTATGEC